jgi:Fe(3+) dicitrate transport protein
MKNQNLTRCALELAVHIALVATPFSAVSAQQSSNAASSPDAGITELATVKVIGDQEKREDTTGSAQIIGQEEIESSRALTVNEALRKVPGLNVRDEEGFGLRPNIGVRGLNPTRSTKVLLLEDGVPAAYAPYGDNASYYHAPIQRYDRIEVLKGMEMLRFGPQSIGAVINYITPDSRDTQEAAVELAAGTRGFANAQAHWTNNGLRIDFSHKQGDGARDNTELKQSDLFAKYQTQINEAHSITLRANILDENSQVGYTGITDAELANFGREYNPFNHDRFDIRHNAFSITHDWQWSDKATLNTSGYYTNFLRDWWRQSSTTTDTQCGAAFVTARLQGLSINPDACNSVQGRLRSYYTKGIEPRFEYTSNWFGAESRLEAGVRWHSEVQERKQVNGTSPTARTGTLAEDNRRETDALSAFLFQHFQWDKMGLNLAIRREHIENFRRNKLTALQGENTLNETMLGIGFNYKVNNTFQWFADVHEGFAPPRAEDVINNSGGSVEVGAERSVNSELGFRGKTDLLDYEFSLFRNDFSNQVLVGSIAGGSTPLAEGESLYQGAELLLGINRDALNRREGEWYALFSLTALPTAKQETPFVAVVGGATVTGSAAGRRLPYAPEQTANIRVGYAINAWDMNLELQHVSSQYADFANTPLPVINGNGQIGKINDYNVFNATVNYAPVESAWSGFVTIKNISDKTYIVDRTRGILLGNPRQIVAGVKYQW